MIRSTWLLALVLAFSGVALSGPEPAVASFEEAPLGELTDLPTSVGRWTADPGHAAIDSEHARTGTRSLHVLGGEARGVFLEPLATGGDVCELSFWAERWTRRAPFEFRVASLSGGTWREIYRGDARITVGGFDTRVVIPLSKRPERIRITCTSPSGVLIDDVRLGRAVPMALASVTTRQPIVPCLVGARTNPVIRLEITTNGCLEPFEVGEVRVRLRGTTSLGNLAAVELLRPDGSRFGRRREPAGTLLFRDRYALEEGVNTLIVSVVLAEGANIDHVVDASCDRVGFSNGEVVEPVPVSPPGVQRCGVALRQAGDEGAAVYRIPAIATTTKGTLVSVYDVRWKGWGDLPGDVDVGMSRSTDGGRTWAPGQVILDMGDDPEFLHDGVGDPAILVDREQGTIWVAATWSHGNRAWRGSGPGLTPTETGQLMLVRSDDDGLTWSKPINITAQVKRPEWCYLLQGPGSGICMRDGTLVFAAQFQDTPGNDRTPYATILYSRDHGETWKLGSPVQANTTEAQVVELAEGVLMINLRDNRGGTRSVYTSTDLGETWVEHPTSRRALVEPVCNAALVRAGARTLLFVNPAVSKAPRRRMTIKASVDLGMTWPEDRQLLLDEAQSAGYASATMIDDEYVGILFEGSTAHITFMRVRVSDLTR